MSSGPAGDPFCFVHGHLPCSCNKYGPVYGYNKVARKQYEDSLNIAVKELMTPVEMPEEESNVDKLVVHPDHYTDGGIETIDYLRAKSTKEEFVGYCRLNALKYLSRAGLKVYDGSDKSASLVRDLNKAIVYLNWAVERLEKDENAG